MKLFSSIALILASFVHTQAWSACRTLDQLGWLLGDWEAEADTGFQQESWQRASNTTFEGIGKALSAQRNITFSESLRLVSMQREIFYLAKTRQNTLPIAFKAVECGDQNAVFENLSHDFPQRLRYSKRGKRLVVDVRDVSGKGFTINYVKQ